MFAKWLVSLFACLLVAGPLAASASTTAAAATPNPARVIDLRKVTCQDLLASDVLDRSALMMFYWGYVSARAGRSVINTADMETATARVMDTCSHNQSLTLFAAIETVKGGK